jgi:hypothetical protein
LLFHSTAFIITAFRLLTGTVRARRADATDSRVRHTWEVPKSRVTIDKQWRNQTLTPMLAVLRDDLGVPQGCRLKAKLHSVLVYAPGKFFMPHQDSEKSHAMVGTLSVIPPRISEGRPAGDRARRLQGDLPTFRQAPTFAAFYADCRHEVRPVRSGYRVVLTYNLMLTEDLIGAAASVAPPVIHELGRCLAEHFNRERRPVPPSSTASWSNDPTIKINKKVITKWRKTRRFDLHHAPAPTRGWRKLKALESTRRRAVAALPR